MGYIVYGLYRNIKVFWEGMSRMSKKKKNIRRKKSNNLLKGMAAAGAVVGGGTIFAGNNAVYAAENEQGVIGSQSEEQIIESQSVSESTTESLSQSKSETSSFEVKELLKLLQLKVILFKQIKKMDLQNVLQVSLIMNKIL